MGRTQAGKGWRGKRKARVFVVDDHEIVRQGLGWLLGNTTDLMVCGEARDAGEVLTGLATAQADVVVLDLELPHGLAFDLIAETQRQWPLLPVMVLTAHEERTFKRRCVAAGASAYMAKGDAAKEIVVALQRVLDGDEAWDLGEAAEANVSLSDREWQVFGLLGRGYSSKEIADLLEIEVRTVETYRRRLKVKLQVSGAGDLSRQALLWTMQGSPPPSSGTGWLCQ